MNSLKSCAETYAKKDDLLAMYTNDETCAGTRPTAFLFSKRNPENGWLVTKCGSIAE